jgi:5'-nucleotidase
MKRPKVVLINDDGIDAPGIYALWEALEPFCDVSIVAPAEDQSCKGVGISLPKTRFIEAEKHPWPNSCEAWRVFGTPADCTKFALHYLLKNPPEFIISGINNGSNAGRNIMYSGTVGAVIQSTFCKVPGIAFSCMYDEGPEKFKKVQPFVAEIVKHFMVHPIPKGTLMNVNFPSQSADGILGFRMAKQGQSYWDVRIGSDSSLKGTRKYPMIDAWDYHEEDDESDIKLLTHGYITCVPVHVQDLTDHEHHRNHKPVFETLNEKFRFSNPPSESEIRQAYVNFRGAEPPMHPKKTVFDGTE